MLSLIQRLGLCSFLFLSCFVICCGQQQEVNKLINEINTAKVKSLKLGQQAQTKGIEARIKFANGARSEGEKLMEEAAKLSGQASDLLNQSADKAEQITKLIDPDWYKDYFTLQSKLLHNLAKLSGGAQKELLARKTGEPSAEQIKEWKDDIIKLRKEREELDKEISKIESEHGIAPIKRE
jgi:hypothetical protein